MSQKGNQFGTLKGVFIPSILTILGVILFLRLGWVVGQAGLMTSIFIILLSSFITFLTGLSISATATNTKIGAGGSYFLISRCFGVEPGAAVGIPLYLAQALGISFYSVGFAESVGLFFPSISITIVAFITLFILTGVTLFSSDLALKAQTFIFAAILLAIGSFWLGSPLEFEQSSTAFEIGNLGFWEIFAVFFPAVTGIEAGISMSGDLENPKKSLPRGTMAAVVVGAAVYIFSAYMISSFAPSEILISNSMLMTEIALVPVLIFIGLWGATLSSAMGALLGAPRTMQALAVDRILPSILGKGSSGTNEPKIATIVSFFIAAAGILIGDLNAIASVLSMFFLTSYGVLNLVSALESLIDSPSWRPLFKVSWVVSMLGAFLCFGAMFMIDSGSSFVALGSVFLVYYIMKWRGLKSNYSDIRSGLVLHFARSLIYKLSGLKKDARNWRPNFLVLVGSSQSHLHLVQLADAISHKRGFVTSATVLTCEQFSPKRILELEKANQEFLLRNKIQSLSKIVSNPSFFQGTMNLIDCYGIGEISPNTIILGDTSAPEDIPSHTKILEESYKRGKNVLVVKDNEETSQMVESGGKAIDVWWGEDSNNRNLMLALAYMLKTSSVWRASQLSIKSIVPNENGRESMLQNLRDFIKQSRIKAKAEVFVGPNENSLELIAKKSKSSDLVFLGLRKPQENDSYSSYYEEMMGMAEKLNTVILVSEAEEISFGNIFR